jgi:hypothetical protein
MHELSIPADLVDRVTTRTGRAHPFDVIEPAKTAFVVVDMQNYFMKPGFQGEVPKARAIVPAVNRLAAAVRELGGHVVWVKNATNDTRESWSVFHDWLHTPQRRDRRYATMDRARRTRALGRARCKTRGRADREEALQRIPAGVVRHRRPSARTRDRHRAHRWHRHQCLLRELGARRHDAELQGGHGA